MEQLRTAFIEGTNEQYSIREDGVVTRHYKYHGKTGNKKYYSEYQVMPTGNTTGPKFNIFIEGKGHIISRKTIMLEAFGYYLCGVCGNKTTRKTGNTVCENCKQERERVTQATSISRNDPNYIKLYREDYIKRNPEKEKARQKRANLKTIKLIPKRYVAHAMQIPLKDLPDELYELYKIQLQLKRSISQKTDIPTNLISTNNVKNQKLLHSNRPNASSI